MSYFRQFTLELHNLLTGVLYRRSPASQLYKTAGRRTSV